ncbi:MAG: Phosphoglycolate phosphatase [Syntrophaceae bacterium PtaU1.Bin231]|nr:MAG: Phosphoglycolate phosphatase [Syntrophaceae bacterium PtaU1.Bin231]
MKNVDLMIFDLDGTLVNSGRDIARSAVHTLKTLGLPILQEEKILTFVGNGLGRLVERALGPAHQHLMDRAMEIFEGHYEQHMLDTTGLYPGVAQMLAHYGAKRKIVVTNKRIAYAKRILEGLGIADRFERILGENSTPYMKPDARLMDTVVETAPERRERTVVIGDGIADIRFAKNAGVLSCAYLNGLTPRELLLGEGPDIVYEHPQDLRELLA